MLLNHIVPTFRLYKGKGNMLHAKEVTIKGYFLDLGKYLYDYVGSIDPAPADFNSCALVYHVSCHKLIFYDVNIYVEFKWWWIFSAFEQCAFCLDLNDIERRKCIVK